ncbi:cobalamin B12-binding domain-containing protein [Actinoplanes sichuanensis]|uniref:B12-binding domain-containing protein n=1 Tax=Actinoplanes sichuanensis TaxID=512349 RepID=A0ABW4AW70_9ACTN|nr:cobalamin-dependent protein [Actinoplanes sichuanensis]BEL04744.1 cobalamin B12-binding domain-containing protein [Actinoplanes sichuanensis]
MTSTAHPECPVLLDLLLAADEPAALRLTGRLLASGATPEDVLLRLIAPVQARIGELWADDSLSAADEHVASYISERIVLSCAGTQRPAERSERLVIACADGEWHTLPSRLLAEYLRLRGYPVTFLGASVPAAHLTSYLQKHEPAAVLVSVSLPVRLPSARRSVLAARHAGVPVLVGGRGFGRTDRWAHRLGADAWAADAVSAAAILETWPPPAAPDGGSALGNLADEEYARLVTETPGLVLTALSVLERWFPPMRGYTGRQREATADDLNHIAAFLAAAVYVDDESLFADFVSWLAGILAARKVPAAGVDLVLEHLQKTLDGRPRTARILTAGRTALQAHSPS